MNNGLAKLLLAVTLSALVTGGGSAIYWSQTTQTQSQAREDRQELEARLIMVEEELSLVRDRQDDVRVSLAAALADLAILKAQHEQIRAGFENP